MRVTQSAFLPDVKKNVASLVVSGLKIVIARGDVGKRRLHKTQRDYSLQTEIARQILLNIEYNASAALLAALLPNTL